MNFATRKKFFHFYESQIRFHDLESMFQRYIFSNVRWKKKRVISKAKSVERGERRIGKGRRLIEARHSTLIPDKVCRERSKAIWKPLRATYGALSYPIRG